MKSEVVRFHARQEKRQTPLSIETSIPFFVMIVAGAQITARSRYHLCATTAGRPRPCGLSRSSFSKNPRPFLHHIVSTTLQWRHSDTDSTLISLLSARSDDFHGLAIQLDCINHLDMTDNSDGTCNVIGFTDGALSHPGRSTNNEPLLGSVSPK